MGRYSQAAKKAADLTNLQLAGSISSLNSMSDEKIQKLFPKKKDKEMFLELMSVVEGESNDANKINSICSNIVDLAPVILKALKYFV